MLEGYERFTKTGRSLKPKVSIRKRGYIGFSKGAINSFDLKDYDYVVMFMSKERQKIAIMFTNNRDERGAVKLIKRPNNFAFSARAFLDYYKIDYTEARTLEAGWDSEAKAVILDLGDTSS